MRIIQPYFTVDAVRIVFIEDSLMDMGDETNQRYERLQRRRGILASVTIQHVQCLIQLVIAIGVVLVGVSGFLILQHQRTSGEESQCAVADNLNVAAVTSAPPGPVGSPGPTGPPGLTGQKGMAGPPGPVGPKGDTGSTGLPGVHGLDGLHGAKGYMGPVGPKGTMGEHGFPGQHGAAGPQGRPGMPGPKGAMGPTGFSAGTNVTSVVEAFSLYRSKGRYDQSVSPVGALHFDNVHFNIGSGLDPTTSVYTSPVRGLYFFAYCLRKDSGGDSDAYLLVNNVRQLITDNDIDEADVKAISGIIELEEGNQVEVQVASSSKIYCFSDTNCRFDGYLLRQY